MRTASRWLVASCARRVCSWAAPPGPPWRRRCASRSPAASTGRSSPCFPTAWTATSRPTGCATSRPRRSSAFRIAPRNQEAAHPAAGVPDPLARRRRAEHLPDGQRERADCRGGADPEADRVGERCGSRGARGDHVAHRQEGRRPGAGSDYVERQEPPEREVGAAREEGRDRPREADGAAQDDRLSTVTLEDALDAGDDLRRDVEAGAVLEQEAAAELATEQEARRVARDRREPDDREQQL